MTRRSTPPLRPARALRDDWWFAVCAMVMLVATEYKWRVRPPDEGLSGAVDLQVLVELAGYGLVAFLLLQWLAPVPRGRRTAPVVWLLAAYTGFVVMSVAWSPYGATAAVRGLETLVVLGVAWTLAQVGDRVQVHRFTHVFIAVTALSVLLGVLYPMEAPWTDRDRFSWLMVHPNTSAVFMGIAIVLAVVYVLAGRSDTAGVRWPAGAYVAALLVLGYGILANHSRGSVAAAFLGVGVAAALVRPLSLRLAALVALLAGAACGLVMFWSTVVAYAERGEQGTQLTSLNGRADLWTVAFESVRDNPVLGSGLYASRGIFYDETGLGGGHNAVVNILVDLGGVGTGLWATLLVALGVVLWRMPALTASGRPLVDRVLVISVTAFLVVNGGTTAGIGGVANVGSIWLFLLVGWVALLQRTRPWARPARPHASQPALPSTSPTRQVVRR